jgi:hypothetical protein
MEVEEVDGGGQCPGTAGGCCRSSYRFPMA